MCGRQVRRGATIKLHTSKHNMPDFPMQSTVYFSGLDCGSNLQSQLIEPCNLVQHDLWLWLWLCLWLE
jgi:hypothetical protein